MSAAPAEIVIPASASTPIPRISPRFIFYLLGHKYESSVNHLIDNTKVPAPASAKRTHWATNRPGSRRGDVRGVGGAEMFEHEHASGRRQLTIEPLRRNRADERRYSAAARLGNFADSLPKRLFQFYAGLVPRQLHRPLALCGGHRPTNLLVPTVHGRPRSQLALNAAIAPLGSPRNPDAVRWSAVVEQDGPHPWRLRRMSGIGLEDAANVPLASIHVVIVFRPLARGTRDRRTAED